MVDKVTTPSPFGTVSLSNCKNFPVLESRIASALPLRDLVTVVDCGPLFHGSNN